jgi:hypothetical protein
MRTGTGVEEIDHGVAEFEDRRAWVLEDQADAERPVDCFVAARSSVNRVIADPLRPRIHGDTSG